MTYTLVFCIFGCDTKPKYRDQILKIEATYAQLPPDVAVQVKFLYFLSSSNTPLTLRGPQFVHLPNVADDYMSASDKQFHGLRYVSEHYPEAKYVMTFGTDTYVNVPKMLKFLQTVPFNPQEEALLIGGHGDVRQIQGKPVYFHSGGPGIILSAKTLALLAPRCDTAVDTWLSICTPNLRPACDVALAYYCQLPDINAKVIKMPGLQMTHCNFRGEPCHPGKITLPHLLSCHLMSLADFDQYTRILRANNYFV
jgi:hypothetical protein